MKNSITQEEYVQLEGIYFLNKKAQETIDIYTNAVADLIGDEHEYKDWSTDFIVSGYNPQELLRKLKITIEG